MLIKTVLLLIAILAPIRLDALRILAIFPYTGKSHHYVFEPLLQRLSSKGHELTVISHFPAKDPPKNWKDIQLVTDMSASENAVDLTELEEIPLKAFQLAFEGNFLYSFGVEMCENLLTNAGVKKLLLESPKFDVALVEQFNSDCLLGIVHKLGMPVVGMTSDTIMPWHFERFGITVNPSHVPCHHSEYGTKPTFMQTVKSMLTCGFLRLGYDIMSLSPTQDLQRKHLGKDMPPIGDQINNVSLLLVNSYFATHGGLLLPPSVHEVGGMHLKNPNELPEELEKFIADSPNGVIYFSLGSMIKSTSMSNEKLKSIQEAFAALPQRILWKWENDTMPGISKNVLVKKWLPQFDILNHKNVKAFISHGGMLSTTEAAHCGVPMVSIPLFGDQFANSAAVRDSGLGTILHYKDITKESLIEAINTVLDPKMQESAKRVSAIWRDRPQPPLETAVYWIEHVARHGGAHLRPASADLSLSRYLLLDVFAFLAVVGVVTLFITYQILLCFVHLIFRSSKHKRD